MSKKFQITLALLKPDVAVNPIAVKAIIRKIQAKNISILKKKTLYWDEKASKLFYQQHRGKFFYRRLTEYTTCGPIIGLVLGGENVIQKWRHLMGPTKTFQAGLSRPYSLRGEYGLSDTRNSTHGSDSYESAREEIESIFGKETFDHLKNIKIDQITDESRVEPQNTSETHSTNRTVLRTLEERFSQLSLGSAKTCESLYRTRVEKKFEWFLDYNKLKEYILPIIKQAIKIQVPEEDKRMGMLDIGCGDSISGPSVAKTFGKSLNVYCIDFTMEALSRLRDEIDRDESFDHVKNCYFVNADITEYIPFEDCSMCAIFDKGTVDAILKQPGGNEKANRALRNILRLLQHKGVFLQVTDEPPEIRLDLLQSAIGNPHASFTTSCQHLTVTDEREYFLYIIHKW